ncbi:AGAP005923PAlike [Caligus rogercresseyi]|uniref:AGAP005923PAlike n=1 Tax=Caligus rogercresseyi TaxID=217165 RepID=A0A7T8GV76_CALRO|nr:AGAP005923PAlike [Caligus rogercresseyi]
MKNPEKTHPLSLPTHVSASAQHSLAPSASLHAWPPAVRPSSYWVLQFSYLSSYPESRLKSFMTFSREGFFSLSYP